MDIFDSVLSGFTTWIKNDVETYVVGSLIVSLTVLGLAMMKNALMSHYRITGQLQIKHEDDTLQKDFANQLHIKREVQHLRNDYDHYFGRKERDK